MELKNFHKRIYAFAMKYKYVLLVLILGLLLLLWPDKKQTHEDDVTDVVSLSEQEEAMSVQLEKILGKIKGAGDVSVMLTVGAGEETVYQTDERASISESADTADRSTVIITDENRKQTGLVKQTKAVRYQGAIIVCDGADDPSVRLSIVSAVSNVTGLGADKISVLLMK